MYIIMFREVVIHRDYVNGISMIIINVNIGQLR